MTNTLPRTLYLKERIREYRAQIAEWEKEIDSYSTEAKLPTSEEVLQIEITKLKQIIKNLEGIL